MLTIRSVTGNHTGYKQVKGTKTSADEILDLYQGLQSAHLSEFDMMLSGYLPSAEAIDAVGKIGRALRFGSSTKPGSFFWGTQNSLTSLVPTPLICYIDLSGC